MAAHLGLPFSGQLVTAAVVSGGAVFLWYRLRKNAPDRLPARANRESNVASSEPVVTSVKATEDSADAKPKKGGWWQKRGGFF